MPKRRGVNEINLGAVLGRGHFGKVVEATVPPHGNVAVKVIDCLRAKDLLGTTSWTELQNHLFAEAVNLSNANHDHVVQVYGVQNSPNRDEVYIIMERCDSSLGALCKDGPTPLAVAIVAIRHALMGLEALHNRNMIHRDLKPSNVLRKGGSFRLGDFGLVTDVLVKGYATRQGYSEHLAPETFDVGLTSPATDVWAMGMTIFRVLNGEPWYARCLEGLGVDKADPIAAAPVLEDLITSGNFAQRLRWMPHVPDKWRRFVRKALSYKVASRYQNGGAMLSGMHGFGVPHGPSWECAYTDDLVRWRRERGAREEIVEWRRISPRKHEYLAFTRNTDGTERRKTLFASKEPVNLETASRELQGFFATRSE